MKINAHRIFTEDELVLYVWEKNFIVKNRIIKKNGRSAQDKVK